MYRGSTTWAGCPVALSCPAVRDTPPKARPVSSQMLFTVRVSGLDKWYALGVHDVNCRCASCAAPAAQHLVSIRIRRHFHEPSIWRKLLGDALQWSVLVPVLLRFCSVRTRRHRPGWGGPLLPEALVHDNADVHGDVFLLASGIPGGARRVPEWCCNFSR
jgi:hypothetical protein